MYPILPVEIIGSATALAVFFITLIGTLMRVFLIGRA